MNKNVKGKNIETIFFLIYIIEKYKYFENRKYGALTISIKIRAIVTQFFLLFIKICQEDLDKHVFYKDCYSLS